MDRLSEIHNRTFEVRSLTIHHNDMGKIKHREESINETTVYESPEADVLGTCKYFSFTLIASLNSYREMV